MKKLKKDTKILLYSLAGGVILFFLWWIIAAIIKSTLFPTPIVVLPVFFSLFAKVGTYQAIGGTLLRVLVGFLISAVSGIILGVIGGYFWRFEAVMKPIVGFLRSIPTAAMVLVLITLLKPLWTPIIISTLVMFPLFYSASVKGINEIDPDLKAKAKMDNATIFNALFRIYLPLISPYLLLAFIQSLGLGMKASIMAEILGGSNDITGLGRLIQYEYIEANATNVLAYSLIAIMLIAIVDIILYTAKRGLIKNDKRHPSAQTIN